MTLRRTLHFFVSNHSIFLISVTPLAMSKFWGPVNAAKFGLNRINHKGSVTFFSGLAAYRPAVGTVAVRMTVTCPPAQISTCGITAYGSCLGF